LKVSFEFLDDQLGIDQIVNEARRASVILRISSYPVNLLLAIVRSARRRKLHAPEKKVYVSIHEAPTRSYSGSAALVLRK